MDHCPDPESKSGPKWPGSGSRVRIRPIMAGIRTFFFLFDFSFSLMPLTSKKKGVDQKAKAKARAKAIRTSFLWLRCVLWCGCLFLSFIERPDQGHLYPLGEPRDTCHSRGANLRPPAPQASALPKELSRQLIAGYSELLLGASGRPPHFHSKIGLFSFHLLANGS